MAMPCNGRRELPEVEIDAAVSRAYESASASGEGVEGSVSNPVWDACLLTSPRAAVKLLDDVDQAASLRRNHGSSQQSSWSRNEGRGTMRLCRIESGECIGTFMMSSYKLRAGDVCVVAGAPLSTWPWLGRLGRTPQDMKQAFDGETKLQRAQKLEATMLFI